MNLLFRTIPAIAKQLSVSSFSACWLAIKLWYFALTRKLGVFSNEFPLSAFYNNQPFTLYLQYVMDLAVLKEVFVDMEYEWELPFEPKVIVDLGAHYGDTALFYHCVYPNAKIIAVEPSPENFSRLKKHVSEIENIIPVNAAVGAEDGRLKLHISKSSLGHSLVEREPGGETVDVEMFSLKTLLEKQGVKSIDLLKFDIEGAEFLLLESFESEKTIQSLIGELHFDLVEGFELADVEAKMLDFKLEVTPIPLQKNRYIVKGLRKES